MIIFNMPNYYMKNRLEHVSIILNLEFKFINLIKISEETQKKIQVLHHHNKIYRLWLIVPNFKISLVYQRAKN